MKLYTIHHNVIADQRDEAIAIERKTAWDKRQGPRVGDFVIMPTGTVERFSYDWGEDIQTCFEGSFHMSKGFASMSGSLNPAIPKANITDTGEMKPGDFWFFHHDYAEAFHAVGLNMDCRVFKYMA